MLNVIDAASKPDFFAKTNYIVGMKTHEIAELLGAELIGDRDVLIERVASLAAASTNELAFVEKSGGSVATKAGCVLVPLGFEVPLDAAFIRTKNPKLAFAIVAEQLHRPKARAGVDPTASVAVTSTVGDSYIGAYAVVGDNSSVGNDCQIHAGVRIAENVRIGDGTIVHANCVIYSNVEIGRNCVLHAGTVIGADGFGFVRGETGYVKFPQIGIVVIEDNVEIGANTCVDRGALGETRIGEGTKIDNLVQVAHNVRIGKRVVIAAQTGISGSTVIEDDCVIGGQVGMGDHATVQSGAVIGSQAGVLPGKIVRPGVWWGTPVQPLDEYKRQNARLKGIGRLKDEVRSVNERLAALEDLVADSDQTE